MTTFDEHNQPKDLREVKTTELSNLDLPIDHRLQVAVAPLWSRELAALQQESPTLHRNRVVDYVGIALLIAGLKPFVTLTGDADITPQQLEAFNLECIRARPAFAASDRLLNHAYSPTVLQRSEPLCCHFPSSSPHDLSNAIIKHISTPPPLSTDWHLVSGLLFGFPLEAVREYIRAQGEELRIPCPAEVISRSLSDLSAIASIDCYLQDRNQPLAQRISVYDEYIYRSHSLGFSEGRDDLLRRLLYDESCDRFGVLPFVWRDRSDSEQSLAFEHTLHQFLRRNRMPAFLPNKNKAGPAELFIVGGPEG